MVSDDLCARIEPLLPVFRILILVRPGPALDTELSLV